MYNFVDVKNHPEMLKKKYLTALNMIFRGGQFTEQIFDIANYEFTNNRELSVDNFTDFAHYVYQSVLKPETSLTGRAYWARHLATISKSDCTCEYYLAQVFYLAGVKMLKRNVKFSSFTMSLAK